jgi:hypothetical protein
MTINFNLLHPVALPAYKPVVKLQDMVSKNIANRRLFLNELKEICTVCHPLVDAHGKQANGVDIIRHI